MAGEDQRFETRTVHTVRGLEARTVSKMEQDGWELVSRDDASMLRTKFTFRRAKKPIPRWVWVAGGAATAAIVLAAVIGSLTEGDEPTAPVTAAADANRSPSPTAPSPSAPSTPAASATPTTGPSSAATVPDAEVLAAFTTFFAQRASDNVVFGTAVSDVTFTDGVVTVTFDPSRAGLTNEAFDAVNPFDNLAKFAATPIAFNDTLGNRVRPAVQSIATARVDGTPLGTYSHAEILALNGLSQ